MAIYYSITPKPSCCKLYTSAQNRLMACKRSSNHNRKWYSKTLISGHHQFGCKSLSSPGPKTPSNKSTKVYSKLISNHYKNIDDTSSISKPMQLQVQGQWTQCINYIQNNFSWKSLLALPVNLVSFYLASTFDVLLSHSSIWRWKISTDAACTLCRKDVCTTAHILRACKVALKQRRYTFRHNMVLQEIVSSLNTFIGSIELVVSKEQNFIKFVKKGTKVKQKKTPHVGTLHQCWLDS